ncbi:glutaminase A [Tropicimonas sp. IMCC34043]|uniref:glutaminase A n=1 Tax=Tropicimonas sp. IMCC34043 TaxID=2248760 RepID=UPI0018E5A5BD|nr:glutaminase A [Tropicimonas sp. IMCC34043]
MRDAGETSNAAEDAGASPIDAYLRDLLERLTEDRRGAVADYIPELGLADPEDFGICIATVDGTIYAVGAADKPFTIQSMSKPFTYGHALNELGRERVMDQVGVEPTGEAFNSIVLDDKGNRPFNPMVNAGAIAVAELIQGETAEQREAAMLGLFSRLAGRPLVLDETVYVSERETGHRNRAIAYLMLNTGMITRPPEEVLDLYFRQCSVLVTARDMAVMGATLANFGRNPLTGAKIYSSAAVRDMLTVMSTCGMYNYAGQWAFDVGIPAKSGVSGGIVAVVPGQLGLAVYSPRLDAHGNSIRGVRACQAISHDFSLHGYSGHDGGGTVIRRRYTGASLPSKRARSRRQRDFLADSSGCISVIEAQGALYFGSAERLIRAISDTSRRCRFLIVDFRRVGYCDPAARRLLLQAVNSAAARGCEITFSGLTGDASKERLREEFLHAPGCSGQRAVEDCDAALETFEDRLLADMPGHRASEKYALSDLELFAGLGSDAIRQLQSVAETFQFDPGEQILAEGDAANLFFILARGSATISIALPGTGRKRIDSVGPGECFGEMALLDGGTRSADVHADGQVVCYGFSVEQIREISQAHPEIHATILANLARILTARLRAANEEIRALE